MKAQKDVKCAKNDELVKANGGKGVARYNIPLEQSQSGLILVLMLSCTQVTLN